MRPEGRPPPPPPRLAPAAPQAVWAAVWAVRGARASQQATAAAAVAGTRGPRPGAAATRPAWRDGQPSGLRLSRRPKVGRARALGQLPAARLLPVLLRPEQAAAPRRACWDCACAVHPCPDSCSFPAAVLCPCSCCCLAAAGPCRGSCSGRGGGCASGGGGRATGSYFAAAYPCPCCDFCCDCGP